MQENLPGPGGPGQPASSPRTWRLSERLAGGRLDLFLAAELGLSRAQVRRLLQRGAVALAGRTLGLDDKGMMLPAAGELSVQPFRGLLEQRPHAEPPGAGAPMLLATGSGWLALDKPAGMPVHPLSESERGSALGFVIARRPEIHGVGEGGLRSGVVHRLDVETSGALLFASEQTSWQRLRSAFAEHRVSKRYIALVAGRLDPPGGLLEVEMPLVVARHRPAFVRMASQAECERGRARMVEQSVRTLELFEHATLVEVHPRTGFLHQIRASLAELGHPVLGDGRYGESASALSLACGAGRQMLHAAEVGFEEIVAVAPDPADLLACVSALRQTGGGRGEERV